MRPQRADSQTTNAAQTPMHGPRYGLATPSWHLVYLGAITIALFAPNCAHSAVILKAPADTGKAEIIVVPGSRQWIDTGLEVRAGEPLTITAEGTIRIDDETPADRNEPFEVGPAGTFLCTDEALESVFPLAAGARGPAPCYCLIGRIGDGEPFFIGQYRSWNAPASGPLFLGINDFEVRDNHGRFTARISRPKKILPAAFERTIELDGPRGAPAPNCSVVVFYVDGLRPDVIREMAVMGHIPHISSLFIERGAYLQNAFTAFPSDTITSNGTMWTGCFSDRHGLKGQVRFSRRTLVSESYLEPLGPNRSARLVAPQGLDKVVHDAQANSIGIASGEEAEARWSGSRTTGVPPLYARLRAEGDDWATGALPMMTEVPPLLWTRSLVRYMPYFRAQDAWQYIDDANTNYTLNHLLARREPVTIVWLPETDSVSHKFRRGQFGTTRRTIARADLLIGTVVDHLAKQNLLDTTYFVLVSDHGHHGGRDRHLSHFDLANEVFHRPRQLAKDGSWVGGGLGMSVRQHRYWNRLESDDSRSFVFVDGDSDGAARVYLPRESFHSGKWTADPRPADMLAYRISEKMPPINLVSTLLSTTAAHGDGQNGPPVDLVMLRLDEKSILISTLDRGDAVIDRRQKPDGRWEYKYTAVKGVRPTSQGTVEFVTIEQPKTDPLGLTKHLPSQLLDYYHDEQAWLRLTAESNYPDGVVVLTRHMLWQENLQYREPEYAPDLVVTARAGWYFGTASSPGTMHGYPFPDAMHATFFVSGPNVRRGARIIEPCRLVDLTPTILEMASVPFDQKELDGTPVRSIYAPADPKADKVRPVYWQDFDLQAWKPIEYKPLEQYDLMPYTVNRPYSSFDANNIAYNLLALGDTSILRLFDDVLFPISQRGYSIAETAENYDLMLRRNRRGWIADGVQALNVTGLAISDYSFTSLGNLMRINGAIEWVQNRGREAESRVADVAGRESIPGAERTQAGVDAVQSGIWEVYRFGQRIMVELLDETLLNGLENSTDNAINSMNRQPAEIVVEEPQPRN